MATLKVGRAGDKAFVLTGAETPSGAVRIQGVFFLRRLDIDRERQALDATSFSSLFPETLFLEGPAVLKLELVEIIGEEAARLTDAQRLAVETLTGDPDAVWPLIDSLLESRDRPRPKE
ncbi:MAG: hypothetical protein LC745_01920 [Planctomycetia bacterium]|nr:hypothetical protein [Planctomycetia bacterium]